jgi:hypothetical protein
LVGKSEYCGWRKRWGFEICTVGRLLLTSTLSGMVLE